MRRCSKEKTEAPSVREHSTIDLNHHSTRSNDTMKSTEIDKAGSIRFFIRSQQILSDRDYDRLSKQIEGHRYFLGTRLHMDITWDEAVYSWQSNIYEPIASLLGMWATVMSFPHHRRADLIFEVIDHLYYLSLEQGREVSPWEAMQDYSVRYGKPLGRILAKIQYPRVA
jgi:hypothetical protein